MLRHVRAVDACLRSYLAPLTAHNSCLPFQQQCADTRGPSTVPVATVWQVPWSSTASRRWRRPPPSHAVSVSTSSKSAASLLFTSAIADVAIISNVAFRLHFTRENDIVARLPRHSSAARDASIASVPCWRIPPVDGWTQHAGEKTRLFILTSSSF